jgi:hypothetical protein
MVRTHRRAEIEMGLPRDGISDLLSKAMRLESSCKIGG